MAILRAYHKHCEPSRNASKDHYLNVNLTKHSEKNVKVRLSRVDLGRGRKDLGLLP